MLVDVALPVPLRRAFTYSLPARMVAGAVPGVRVRVPFGKRTLVGVLLGPTGTARAPLAAGEIREIEEILDETPVLPPLVLDLVLWLADYYQAPAGEAVRLALPPSSARWLGRAGISNRVEPTGVAVTGTDTSKTENGGHSLEGIDGGEARPLRAGRGRASESLDGARGTASAVAPGGARGIERDEEVHLVRLAPDGAARIRPLPARATRLRAVLEELPLAARPDGWATVEELRARTGAGASHLRRLAEDGWIERAVTSAGARSDGVPTTPPESPHTLAAAPVLDERQSRAAGALKDAIDRAAGGVFVLRGVTGSGKTEVYFDAARRALDRGRAAIFLVPEIGLTPLFVRRVRNRFGDQVALIHSRLTPAERLAAWRRVREGRALLVVGPRSALFAPAERVGLIVVDEEHDASYKQEEMPRYNARDLALVRGRLEGAVVVLGSATPSLETWHAARSGRYGILELGERVRGRPMPRVEIVDMREEARSRGEPVLLSARLVAALEEIKTRGEQAIVLLNRRGYAAFVICRACGEPFGCPRCSVSLVYHRIDETLRCHYCGYRRSRPSVCDRCGSEHLLFPGEGTERVERHLARAVPGLRIARLDRDSARGAGAHGRILGDFEKGLNDVLVGTQMVAKGHDFPGVTLVGVLAADAILGFPDFRAAERTFQLLTQVAGRAGRGERPGLVLVQAYRRDHYALEAAARHDHEGFFEHEIRYRRALAYPPFTHLASLTVLGKDLAKLSRRAHTIAAALAEAGAGRVQVLGPALAPIARLRGLFRLQILLKARARRRLGDVLARALETLGGARGSVRDVIVDVDPLQLL